MSLCVYLDAQCPMCRMSVESNLQDGGSTGRTLNAGILYMLLMPYALVAILGYVWYKNKKKAELEEESAKAQMN
jgi:hypothetical protein